MARAPALLLSMTAFVFCVATSTIVRAQPARAQLHAQQLAHLPDIKGAIVKAIGADADKIELNTTPSMFRVVLVNGKMNDASAAGHRRHCISARILLLVTSGGAGRFDGPGQRAISADPDDPSSIA